jgi:hypothetical protein
MAKCGICGKKVDETFLGKLVGTYIKDAKGKRRAVCFECQSSFKNDKGHMMENLK